MNVNKGDFVELNYTGKIMPEEIIFDTTVKEVAEKAGLEHDHEHNHDQDNNHEHEHSHEYKPLIVCIGERHVLPGLDAKISG